MVTIFQYRHNFFSAYFVTIMSNT